MNQKSRQQSKNSKAKYFFKLNNSNFAYDCRNNLDNYKFVRIFDEFEEITFINRYRNIFDPKISQFVTSELLKADIEEKSNDNLSKSDKEDEIKSQTERLQQLEAAEKFEQQKKKIKKEQN